MSPDPSRWSADDHHAAFWLMDARWTLEAARYALRDESIVDESFEPEDDDPLLLDHSLIDNLDDDARRAFAARAVRQVKRSLEEACTGTDLMLPLFTPPATDTDP